MTTLKNIKKAPLEMGQLLANNNKLCNLLYLDIPSALEETSISHSLNDLINDHYITIYPPVETAIKDNTRNSFLIILLDNVNLQVADNNTRANFVVYVTTDVDHILLNNNKNRLLEMCDEVIKTLNGVKLSSAGIVQVSSIAHVMLSEFRAGYRISLSLTDQASRKAEI